MAGIIDKALDELVKVSAEGLKKTEAMNHTPPIQLPPAPKIER